MGKFLRSSEVSIIILSVDVISLSFQLLFYLVFMYFKHCGERQKGSNRKNNPVVMDCLKFFHSPLMKYYYSMMCSASLLVFYSYIVLCNYGEETTIPDIILMCWVGALYFREFCKGVHGWTHGFIERCGIWLSNPWNKMDFATAVVFTAGAALKLSGVDVGAARAVHSVVLLVLYIRLCMEFFMAHRHVGPLLQMIKEMVKDLFYFMGILFVFLIGYGVASQAILYPNTTDPVQLIEGVFKRAYFHIFGELFLEEIQLEKVGECTTNITLATDDLPRCPQYSWVGMVLLTWYIMISNVLLLNILIAMFSNTFTRVEEHSTLYWKIQQFSLVSEYIQSPILQPPFNLLYIPYCTLLTIASWCKGRKERDLSEILQRPGELTEGNKFEEQAFHKYMEQKAQAAASHDITLDELNERVTRVSEKLDKLLEDENYRKREK